MRQYCTLFLPPKATLIRIGSLVTIFLPSAAFYSIATASSLNQSPNEAPAAYIYRFEVVSIIQHNWKLDRSKTNNESLMVEVVFKVLPDGRVTDFRFEKQSYNKYMDASVLNAFIKSIPFHPFPSEVRAEFINVSVRFTSEGDRFIYF